MIYKLKDICDIFDGPHATPPEVDDGPIFLGIKNINEQCELDYSDIKHLSEEDYVKWTKRVIPQKDDIVFSYEATLNRYALIPDGFYGCLGRRLAIARVKDTNVADPHFLYHYFCSPKWNAFIIANKVVGSTVLRVSVEDFPDYEVDLPDIATQNTIALILDNILEKKRNNTLICDHLESMAKLLYDYWFVQFDFPNENGKPYKSSGGKMVWNEELKREIPEGWKVTTIGNITACHDSERIPVANKDRAAMSGNIPYYGATGIMGYVNRAIFSGDYVLLAEDGSVMDENGHPIIQRISGDVWVNNHAHVLEPIRGYSCRLLMMILKDIPVIQIKTGSIQMKINQDNMNRYKIIDIPEHLVKDINQTLNVIDEKLLSLDRENRQLTALRDFLLPMLMNGQVKVGKA